MKRFLLSLFLVIFGCFGVISCAPPALTTTKVVTTTIVTPSPTITTIMTILPTLAQGSLDNQFFISVNVGDEFTVILDVVEWGLTEWVSRYDKGMFELVEQVFKPKYPVTAGAQTTMVGGGGKLEYHFKAVKQGQDTIAFIEWYRGDYQIINQVMYLIEVR